MRRKSVTMKNSSLRGQRAVFYYTPGLFNCNGDIFVYCLVVFSFNSNFYLIGTFLGSLSNYDLTVFVNFDLGVVCCVRNFTSFLSYFDSFLKSLAALLNCRSLYSILVSRL